MAEKMRLILIAAPEDVRQTCSGGLTVAHMAYRIGNGPHLFRSSGMVSARKGIMVIDDKDFGGGEDTEGFCQEVIRECVSRSFTGAVLDFEGGVKPSLLRIAESLARSLQQSGLTLYVPEAYAFCGRHARVLIGTAISGGSLERRLEEAVGRYGADRVALEVERVCADFYLPAPDGEGRKLSREELQRLIDEKNPFVFFSRELCARYFTFMDKKSGAHFILFDDLSSIRQKLQIAGQLGIREAFFLYPEVKDILNELME